MDYDMNDNELLSAQNLANKHLDLFLLTNEWLNLRQSGTSLVAYLEKNHFFQIAIYGFSFLGKSLVLELEESNISIKYIIDKRIRFNRFEIKMINNTDNLERVDAVLVTPITFFEEIKKELEHKIDCPIISLEELIYCAKYDL